MTEPREDIADESKSSERMTQEQQQFASDLQLMQERAIRIGLYAIGQRLSYPIRMVGFELAGTPELCAKYEQESMQEIERR